MAINQITMIGQVAKAPKFDTIQTKNGPRNKCEISVKVEHKSKENFVDTCFISIVVWEKQADYCAATFFEGSPIAVSGRLKYESWTDAKSGLQRGRHIIIPDKIMDFGGALENTTSAEEEQPTVVQPMNPEFQPRTTTSRSEFQPKTVSPKPTFQPKPPTTQAAPDNDWPF